MVADPTAVVADLSFAPTGAAALPYTRAVVDVPAAPLRDRAVLYHAFVYLRYLFSDSCPPAPHLGRARSTIPADPHRLITRPPRAVPRTGVRYPDPTGLEALVAGAGGLPLVALAGRWAGRDAAGPVVASAPHTSRSGSCGCAPRS